MEICKQYSFGVFKLSIQVENSLRDYIQRVREECKITCNMIFIITCYVLSEMLSYWLKFLRETSCSCSITQQGEKYM